MSGSSSTPEVPRALSSFDALAEALRARTNYELQAPPPGGFHLERMRRLVSTLGDPQRAYPVLHVAGTKGKGSTCAAIASAADAAGLRVGLNTSPHLVHLRERIRLGARPAPDALWLAAADEVLAAADGALASDPPTYFELVTATALVAFRRAAVDLAVIEVGLGGRLDATNVVDPAVSVITRIARDHVALLGPDEAAIAREKAGILRPGVPAVIGPEHPLALDAIERRAAALGTPLWVLGREVRAERAGDRLRLITPVGACELRAPGPGRPLATNLALAAGALALLEQGRGLGPDQDATRRGFERLRWRGRFDRVRDDPPLVLDGAHDVASLAALFETLEEVFPGQRPRVLFAVARDKPVAEMLDVLARRAQAVTCCASSNPRAADPSELAAALRARGVEAHAAEGTPAEALRASTGDGPLVATGSLYLVGELLAALGVDADPAWLE